MPTTKKTKVATETTPIADETAQESPEIREQSRASGQAMFDNACREIARLTNESTDLHSSIDAKQSEIAEIRREIQQDEQAYEAAEHAKDEAAQRITRQRTRVSVAEGTSSQAEHAAILEGLLASFETAQRTMEEASAKRAESEKKQPLIGALQNDIVDEQAKLAEIVSQLRELESVKSESWSQVGRDEANLLRGEIEALQEELAAHEEAILHVKDGLKQKLGTIRKRLERWPGLATSVELSHGPRLAEDDQATEIEHLFFAQIAFIRAVYSWKISGPRQLQGRHPLHEALALTPQTIYNLMNMDNLWLWRYTKDEFGREHREPICQQIEVAEKWIEQERQKRPQSTIGVPLGLWSAPRGPI